MKVKEITNKNDIDYLLSIEEKDITKTLIVELFGNFDNKPRFNTTDVFVVPPNSYGPPNKRNKNSFRTTVGLWIYNRYFIEKQLFHIFKYINEEINGDYLDDMNKKISYSLLEQELTINDFKPYIMKQQHMMRFVSVLSPNHSVKMLKSSSYLSKKRDELIKKHKTAIENGDEIVSAQIEKELLDIASKYLEDDPSMDLFKSKSRGSFSNNFKNMFVMRGAIMNPDTGKFDICTSNYMDGVKKEEYSMHANSLVGAGFAKAKNTEVGGYMAKQYLQAFQHIVLNKDIGYDCGTKKYITVTINKGNIGGYMYSNIIEGSKLIELNSKTVDKYMGKTVKLRFSSQCEDESGYCAKCCGSLFYKLGIYNAGMTSVKIPNTVMNKSMKKFHDSTHKIIDMDVAEAFGE